MKLKATVTQDMCPFLPRSVTFTNRIFVRTIDGYIKMYVTPDLVVCVVKNTINEWSKELKISSDIKVYEIKCKIEEIF